MSRRARGVLPVIAGLFIASGFLRLGGDAGQVFAAGQAQGMAEGHDEAAACAAPGESMALVEALRAREERVATRETQLADRMQALRVAEAEIEARLAELTAAEAALSATLSLAETAAESDLGQLTAVYENMKPAEAAALFEEMSPPFAAGFLGRMRPDVAAAIMAGLEPGTAYQISVVLAGRNASVPRD